MSGSDLVLGSIHDIPYEITSEIFLHCLPDSEFVAPNPKKAPLLVSQISKRMRAVALSTPALWCSLLVDLGFFRGISPGDHDNPGKLELFRIWLSRACTLPLTVKVYDSRGDYQGSGGFTAADSMIQMLLGLAKQWRSITLSIHPDNLFTVLSCAEDLPMLRNLTIGRRGYSRRRPSMRASLPQHLTRAPKLRQVHLHYIPSATVPLPWRQLTTFSGEGYAIPECLLVLRDAPNLLCCTFTIKETAAPLHIVSAARLRSLTLNDEIGTYATGPMDVLGFLTLPSLRHLSINYRNRRTTIFSLDTAPFLTLVARSSFDHLRKLTLRLWPASEEAIIQCLHVVPTVNELKLEIAPGIGPTDRIFRRLTGTADFLPRLEQVYFREHGDSFIVVDEGERTPAVFLAMLEARWAPQDGMAQLRSLHFEYRWGNAVDDAFGAEVRADPRWGRLRDEGMELFVYATDEG
ncbi:hypothetical protein FB451DRAFT_486696 [Mycena latifolia]|nr:hypothetical protein FB451DRAFT_486696 [Mycena latifolia]